MAELNEVVAEAADEVAETATHVAEVSRALSAREVRLVLLAAAAGITGGFAVGYFIAKRRLRSEYTKLAEDEIQVVRDHYNEKLSVTTRELRGAYERELNGRKPQLDDVMQQLGYQSKEVVVDDEDESEDEIIREPVFTNVFEEQKKQDVEEWDYAQEVKSRDPEVPYVIHVDEFKQNEKEHIHAQLTYYEDDDVLADEQDHVIEDQDATIGVQNLGKFGHGSGDPHVVHVRNDVLGVDYEIVKSAGSYAQEVHGFQHSENPVRRSRHEWDG